MQNQALESPKSGMGCTLEEASQSTNSVTLEPECVMHMKKNQHIVDA